MKTKEEAGVMQPQAKEFQKLPEAGRSKEDFPHRAFSGSTVTNNLISDSGLQNCDNKVLQFVVICYSSHKKLIWKYL
jgi:hypothetical protein